MALIKCPECGKQISDKAISCPNCGYPLEKTENTECVINGVCYDFSDVKKILKNDISNGCDIAMMKINEITKLDGEDCYTIADYLYCHLGEIPKEIDIEKIKEIDDDELNIIFKNNLKKSDIPQKMQEERNSNKPKCPTCHTTNIQKISGAERMTSVLGLGILSKKINKTYKCKYCGYTW